MLSNLLPLLISMSSISLRRLGVLEKKESQQRSTSGFYLQYENKVRRQVMNLEKYKLVTAELICYSQWI